MNIAEQTYNLRPRYEKLAATQLLVTVKQLNITTATGEVSVYQGSEIYEDKFSGGLDGVCIKVDSFGNTLEESALTTGGSVISVISISSDGSYELSGTPSSSAAIRYILLTTIEGLQNIPIAARESLRFVESTGSGQSGIIWQLKGNYDAKPNRSVYLDFGNSPSNEVQAIVPFDGEITQILVSSSQSSTWIAEVHRNNTLVTGASLGMTNERYKDGVLSITVSKGDLLSLYANTTQKIYNPQIEIIIIKT